MASSELSILLTLQDQASKGLEAAGARFGGWVWREHGRRHGGGESIPATRPQARTAARAGNPLFPDAPVRATAHWWPRS